MDVRKSAIHTACGQFAASISLAAWGVCAALSAGDLGDLARDSSVLDRIPLPPGLADVAGSERVEFLINHIDGDPAYPNHLLNIYIKIPALLGMKREMAPEPAQVLALVEIRATEMRERLGARLKALKPADLEARTEESQDREIRDWLLLTGILASGKRTLNGIGDDGGREFRDVFAHSVALGKADPALFTWLIEEFCQFADRPYRVRRSAVISHAQTTAMMFMPVFLVMPQPVTREPDLKRLYPNVMGEAALRGILINLPAEACPSFASLARVARLVAGLSADDRFAKARRPTPPWFLPYLERCVEHPEFAEFPDKDKAAVLDALKLYAVKVDD